MMTDLEVVALYRCLLGRDPEAANTIAAFQSYYATLDQGRRAIFVSSEFRTVFAQMTGRVLDAGEHVAASLALALLQRAGPAATPDDAAADPVLAAGMRRFFDAADKACFAVMVGRAPGMALHALAPFAQAEAAILQANAAFHPTVPAATTLPDRTALFQLGAPPQEVSALLTAMGRPIDALYLLDGTASAQWMDALRGNFAQRTLLVLGPAQDGFDPAALEAEIRGRHHCEPSLSWCGLTLLQVGGWMLPVTYTPPPRVPAAPKRAGYPALAIASIVRDEAVCVRNMLASTQPVASFYAVLDTGSRDATPALAQAFLAECGVPSAYAQHDHTLFDDDFAAMRNAALGMVPDWIAWVLMLDADEELVAEDHTALLALLAQAEERARDAGLRPAALQLPRRRQIRRHDRLPRPAGAPAAQHAGSQRALWRRGARDGAGHRASQPAAGRVRSGPGARRAAYPPSGAAVPHAGGGGAQAGVLSRDRGAS